MPPMYVVPRSGTLTVVLMLKFWTVGSCTVVSCAEVTLCATKSMRKAVNPYRILHSCSGVGTTSSLAGSCRVTSLSAQESRASNEERGKCVEVRLRADTIFWYAKSIAASPSPLDISRPSRREGEVCSTVIALTVIALTVIVLTVIALTVIASLL